MRVVHEPDGDFWRVTLEGAVSFETFGNVWRTIEQHPRYHPGASILWDLRAADVGRIETATLDRLVAWVQRQREVRRGARVALVTSRDVDFGVARMYEIRVSNVPMEVQVFRDMAAAEAWMRRAGAH